MSLGIRLSNLLKGKRWPDPGGWEQNTFLPLCLFLLVTVALQVSGGAFSSEFGSDPDEAGHYVTGLMIRDYITSPRLGQPMKFAENYYLHYPKVALGHWPPFFYLVQAAWTLPFSASRTSVLLLMTVLTTLLAVTVYLTIRSEFGSGAGIAGGLLFIALPIIQRVSGAVMAEILVALLSFWAVLCFGRFLETERWLHAMGFGILAMLAILSKGNGLALALVPLVALLLSRRFHLATRLSFWLPAVVVLVSCGPWYWLTLDMVRNGWEEGGPSLKYSMAAIHYYAREMLEIIGIGLSLVAAIGFVVRVLKPWRQGGALGNWAAVGALVFSVWAFHSVVPSGLTDRHLITAVPALLMFLAAGVAWVAERLPLHFLTPRGKMAVLVFVVGLVFAGETFVLSEKAWHGFGEIAQRLLSTPDFEKSVFLVSSDASGEGMFISEVAMRERRPGHVVMRASKSLANSRWDGGEYVPLYRTPEEMMRHLEGIPVAAVVIDRSIPVRRQVEHHRLLEETLGEYPERWEFLGSFPLMREGILHRDALRVYRLVGHESKTLGKIRIDMRQMLKRTIEK